jgi:lysine 2,3-aminomutase
LTGVKIIEALRGHTTGYAIPQFVIDAPDGGGKIPLNPNYLERVEGDKLHLRNFEGKALVYDREPATNSEFSGLKK